MLLYLTDSNAFYSFGHIYFIDHSRMFHLISVWIVMSNCIKGTFSKGNIVSNKFTLQPNHSSQPKTQYVPQTYFRHSFHAAYTNPPRQKRWVAWNVRPVFIKSEREINSYLMVHWGKRRYKTKLYACVDHNSACSTFSSAARLCSSSLKAICWVFVCSSAHSMRWWWGKEI